MKWLIKTIILVTFLIISHLLPQELEVQGGLWFLATLVFYFI